MLKKITTIILGCSLVASTVNVRATRNDPFWKNIPTGAVLVIACISPMGVFIGAKKLFWDTNPNKNKATLKLALAIFTIGAIASWFSLYKKFPPFLVDRSPQRNPNEGPKLAPKQEFMTREELNTLNKTKIPEGTKIGALESISGGEKKYIVAKPGTKLDLPDKQIRYIKHTKNGIRLLTKKTWKNYKKEKLKNSTKN